MGLIFQQIMVMSQLCFLRISMVFIAEEVPGLIHQYAFSNGVVGDQIKTIETGVNDLSGLYPLQLPDGFSALISLHGSDAIPNGSRLVAVVPTCN